MAEAARISGCSRETIYKNRRLIKENGPEALTRTFRKDMHHKNRTPKNIEKTAVQFSLKNPHLGQAQVSAYLKLQCYVGEVFGISQCLSTSQI
ncbi:hypothetical protein AB835_10730 [Candidatus Endobugula sertula]|uniref:Uncharacterized protein n=1 Tax=Candidatus Endobugula sertula TaxID=62101 RepID=A0A1D2QNC4_9GAMM|nr:hypothetical protein AB835_10730 [Candidatus Endobugula sertula]